MEKQSVKKALISAVCIIIIILGGYIYLDRNNYNQVMNIVNGFFYQDNIRSLDRIDKTTVGQEVKVEVLIIDIREGKNDKREDLFFTLADSKNVNKKMDAVLFEANKYKDMASELRAAKQAKKKVLVTGKVNEYNKKIQIIIQKVGE